MIHELLVCFNFSLGTMVSGLGSIKLNSDSQTYKIYPTNKSVDIKSKPQVVSTYYHPVVGRGSSARPTSALQ
jgi:hypothetical protein